jgi:hypothetical protein
MEGGRARDGAVVVVVVVVVVEGGSIRSCGQMIELNGPNPVTYCCF